MKHKKVYLITALVLIPISTLFFIGRNATEDPIIIPEGAESLSGAPLSVIKVDTDNDGLSDDSEKLLGTDINNTDTDGDGTSDFDEVLLDRNPLNGEENDNLSTELSLITPEVTEAEYLELRQDFLVNYLKERGDEVGAITFEKLIQSVDETEFDSKYTIDMVKITPSNSVEAYKDYANQLGAIFSKYGNSKEYPINEFDVLNKAFQTKDNEDLQELKLSSIVYANITSEILAIPVPFSIAKYHVSLINGYNTLAETTNAMVYMFTEPLRGGYAYEEYIKQQTVIKLAFMGILDYYIKNEIHFEKTEPGWIFDSKLIDKELENIN